MLKWDDCLDEENIFLIPVADCEHSVEGEKYFSCWKKDYILLSVQNFVNVLPNKDLREVLKITKKRLIFIGSIGDLLNPRTNAGIT